MRYLVIGAGGTGGAIGGFLARAGKDVTLIARGKHLEQMQQNGLCFETTKESFAVPVHACTMEEYRDLYGDQTPDVIFVCVKGYSLEDTIPFINQVAAAHTIVIPILNIYGTGRKLQTLLPHLTVTDGCIYIASQIKAPGIILMSGSIFRVVFGLRKGTADSIRAAAQPLLEQTYCDLEASGITPLLSNQIEKDALQKFSFVSPMAALGAGYCITAKDMQTGGTYADTYIRLVQEIKALSDAMDVSLPEDIVDININIMNGLAAGATASMQRDIRDGKPSEVDGLVYEVVRMGEAYDIPVPTYAMIADRLRTILG